MIQTSLFGAVGNLISQRMQNRSGKFAHQAIQFAVKFYDLESHAFISYFVWVWQGLYECNVHRCNSDYSIFILLFLNQLQCSLQSFHIIFSKIFKTIPISPLWGLHVSIYCGIPQQVGNIGFITLHMPNKAISHILWCNVCFVFHMCYYCAVRNALLICCDTLLGHVISKLGFIYLCVQFIGGDKFLAFSYKYLIPAVTFSTRDKVSIQGSAQKNAGCTQQGPDSI